MDAPYHPAFQRLQRQAIQLFHLLLRRDPHSHWPRWMAAPSSMTGWYRVTPLTLETSILYIYTRILYIYILYVYIYIYNIYIYIYNVYIYIHIHRTYIYIYETNGNNNNSKSNNYHIINYGFTSHLRLVSNDFEGLVIARSHFLSYQPTISFLPCSLAVGCRNPYLTVDFIPIFYWSKTINTNSCGLNPCFFPS